MIRRHFAVGELSPAAALVEDPSLDFRSPRGREAIAEVSRRLEAVDLVAEVRSLTQPVGKPLAARTDRGFFGQFAGQVADQALRIGAESRYVSVRPAHPADTDHVTRFDIVFKTDPFSEASLEALDRVRLAILAAAAPGSTPRGDARRRPGRLDLGGQRPPQGHDRRPAADVRPDHARRLCHPGHAPATAGHRAVPRGHRGPGLSGIAGIDRPGLPRACIAARRPGAGSTGPSASSSS